MKDNLPYFSHDNDASHHPKMRALIIQYGYEGYGRFWILNERIARSPNAVIDISRKVNKLDLANELGFESGNELDEFLNFLADSEIDLIKIEDGKVTTARVTELFNKTMDNRKTDRHRKKKKDDSKFPVGKSDFPGGNNEEIDNFYPENEEFRVEKHTEEEEEEEEEKTKKKKKQDFCGSDEPPFEKTFSNQKPDKSKKPPLREREPVNDMERVEKIYLKNWDMLYSQGRVQNPEPLVKWIQTRKLLKDLFEKMKMRPEQIIQAINNGLKDERVMKDGYSLSMMLSVSILNRLINVAPSNKNNEDITSIWNNAREFWNEQNLKPECRNDFIDASDNPGIMRTFQHYSLDEIKNAIENYSWHKCEAGSEYRPPPPYLSLAGFLKAGVEKYFDDNAFVQQFKEKKK
jgi:hypothetical protein